MSTGPEVAGAQHSELKSPEEKEASSSASQRHNLEPWGRAPGCQAPCVERREGECVDGLGGDRQIKYVLEGGSRVSF